MRKPFVIGLCLYMLMGCSTPVAEEPVPEDNTPEEPEAPVEPAYRSLFNGEGLDVEAYKAVAVMIGNTSEARPQAGLSEADVVYEIMMEGMSITRLMAIFSSVFPEKVGPIRSVRVPFVQKLMEWDIGIAHYGGAGVGKGDALTLLDNNPAPIRFDGVKGYNTEYFWRDAARKAPHNAYINPSKAILDPLVKVMAIQKHFSFDPEALYTGDNVELVKIRYASDNLVEYAYDPVARKFIRSVNEEVQVDANNGASIAVTNLIIQTVTYHIVEDVGYVLCDFTGSGEAEYFIAGKHILGTWERADSASITAYYDADHNEIKLLPGNTWIEVALQDKTELSFE